MNFPIMKVQEINIKFDVGTCFKPGLGLIPSLGECHFYQEVSGVVDAVKWVYRNGYVPTFGWMNDYWAAYSLGVELIHIVYGSQIRDEDLQRVDAHWKQLSDDPFADAEEALEVGNDVSNSSDSNKGDKEGISQERGETRFPFIIPDLGFSRA